MTAYNFSVIEPYTYELPKFSYGHMYMQEFEFAFAAPLANGDTITTPAGGLPSNGIVILDTEIVSSIIDTNAAPTGTYNLGDSGLATRFISAGVLGANTLAKQIKTEINQAQTVSASNVVTAGAGYFYADGTNPQLILAVNAAIATSAGSGYIRLKVLYNCDGDV
jgi:hypothetical protein